MGEKGLNRGLHEKMARKKEPREKSLSIIRMKFDKMERF